MKRAGYFGWTLNAVAVAAMVFTSGCAMVGVPDARNVNIPAPTLADSRKQAINERPDSVMYLPLGEDVLVPEVAADDDFPHEMVGPFELRGETLAGALQLILADYDISLAFQTQEGLTRRITVANLRGDLGKVVHEVCSLANLYCSYEDGTVVVKDTQTFTVTLPPIGAKDDKTYMDDVAAGLAAILDGDKSSSGSAATTTTSEPIVDPTTRTIVYSATQRTADVASRYFQRLRANTAMIVFETYIWEVSLNSGNSTGIDWTQLATFGKYNTGVSVTGGVGADFLKPVSIGLPTVSGQFDGTSGDLIKFLSQFGAVKTISQPQITVLSGAEAELRVADTQNYVSQIATTLDQGQSTTSVSTDSVDTGFTLTINSTWDKSTVYANVDIELTDVKQIDDFAFTDTGDTGGSTTIQLPQTSERQLSTQIRVRPGDSVLIAGLKRENDNFDSRGLGAMKPIIPDSRTAQTQNLELVVLLRPRVVVYTSPHDPRYLDYAMTKHIDAEKVNAQISKEDVPEAPAPKNIYPAEKAVAPVTPVAPAPPVTLAPEPAAAPAVTPSWESAAPVAATPAPVAIAPEPVTPAPLPLLDTTASAPAPTPSVDVSRFRRAGGFVSRDTSMEPSVAPAPVYGGQASDSLSSSTVPATTPPATPGASPYETYDYYMPR